MHQKFRMLPILLGIVFAVNICTSYFIMGPNQTIVHFRRNKMHRNHRALTKNQVVDEATGLSSQPEFTGNISNLTIPVARDATFKCYVQSLGGYRVGWVKVDTKAIQAIHDHVITHNPRISVSHVDHTTWNLHIHRIQEEDRGQYMCQINTNPMQSQTGYLDVVVPPDFVFEETSSDVEVTEGGTVKLVCRAKGHPEPTVAWKRENGKDIILRSHSGTQTKISLYKEDSLTLVKINRNDMGAYLCLASNGIPPSVSKRIIVTVNFRPVIRVPNQLVGAPLGTDVTLECYVEASPKTINYWIKDQDGMVISSTKYGVDAGTTSLFEAKMVVTIRNLRKSDVGTYRCLAKNSLGEVESNVRLYDIPGPTRLYASHDEDDYDNYGSAENDERNEVSDRGRIIILNTRNPSRGHKKGKKNHVPASSSGNSLTKSILSYATLLLFIALWEIIYMSEI